MGEEWSVEANLLALAIEVFSVQAAGRQLRKPIQVPRPKPATKGPQGREAKDAAYKRGVAVLASTARGVAR